MKRVSTIVMLMLFAACSQPSAPAATQSPERPVSERAVNPNGPRVVFPDGFIVHVEIAADPELRAQGLMYRDQLRPGTGMLFLFPNDDEDLSFWMKNTLIPLDMIWIDSSQRVAAVTYNVPPCKTEHCPSYSPNATSRYVLEVAGGVALQHGIKAGDQLRFVGIDHIVAR